MRFLGTIFVHFDPLGTQWNERTDVEVEIVKHVIVSQSNDNQVQM